MLNDKTAKGYGIRSDLLTFLARCFFHTDDGGCTFL
jgi:hypothetical protein